MYRYLFIISCIWVFVTATVQAESRLALVIGNGDYQYESKLDNPVNDAKDMAGVLKNLGFEVLSNRSHVNLSLSEMDAVLQEFGEKLRNYEVGLFYYSGHGVQVDGSNYLLPVDAQIRSKLDINRKSLKADDVLKSMEEAGNRLNIVILDACRDNPLKTNVKGIRKGLTEMKTEATGFLIAFATSPDMPSWGDEGERNSIYTKHLLRVLRTQAQLSVLDLLTDVAGSVKAETKGEQVPWKSDSLTERFYFSQSSSVEVVRPPKTFPVPSREVRSWKAHSGGNEGVICLGHCLAFTPDGQLLASGSYDKTIKLWQVSTGQLLNTWSGHKIFVFSVAFSPDGQRLASGSADNTIKLWQVSTGQLLNTWSGHKDVVLSVAFSPDGQWLTSGSMDKTIKLWQVNTGQLLNTWSGHDDYVSSVAFSPDGQRLASGSVDNTIKLWQVSTGQLLNTWSGHKGTVFSVAFSPDGQWLASGSSDKTIKLWQVSTEQLLNTWSGHKGTVFSVAFSPDGQWLASGSSDKTIKLWQVSTGQLLKTLTGHKGDVMSVAFSPDGRLVSGDWDGVIKLWE